ncbi:Wiskott-Aldrich syndrome protein family member 1 [Schistosoma japonicum]|nr:Wiskott-Aldrich syndrome protein family member 1 [Schistosoma japonicum]KAH8864014.1 Wiskott-Aldrich syndrome protein family member 1 [Schistosoma japonicum]
MPLPKHTVQPVKLSQVVVPNGIDNELEFVVNSTVCNVMRQIASVSRLANNMFEELTSDLSGLIDRTVRLQNRLSKLQEDMQMARNGDEDLTAGVHEVELPVFVSKKPTDSQVLNRNTIPPSMQSQYDQAEPAPALQQMDALRDDKKTSMKLYSDPSFFFDLWSQEMLQDHKHKRAAKKKRPKVKGKAAPVKSSFNQVVQKSQLVIQQPGVGGHNPSTPLFEHNGSMNTSVHVDRDSSVVNGKLNQHQFPNNPYFASNPLPPPPPPPTHSLAQVNNVKDVLHVTDQKSDYHPAKPTSNGVNQFPPIANHINSNYDLSPTHQMTLPEPPTLHTRMASSHVSSSPPPPPLPPSAFSNNNQLKMPDVDRNSPLSDETFTRDCSAQSGNCEISSSTQMHDEKYSQYNSPGSIESSSLVIHDLPPPPPAPIFEEKNLNEPCKLIGEPTESDICDYKSTYSVPPPPVAPSPISSPQTSLPCPPTQQPPPPPPPLVLTKKVGPESSSDQTTLQNKNNLPRCSLPQCPPADLLSAIRAGFQLRKVGERNPPDPSKCSRGNSLSTLGNKPKDVQAIYEAVRRRRECMENNSSEDDDDDKDVDSDSSGWED